MLRVLHILWRGDVGGAERAVFQLARRQDASEGFQIAVAFGQAEGPYSDFARAEGLRVVDFGMRSGRDLVSLPRVRKLLQEFDVHHFHSAEPAIMVASVLARNSTRIYTHRAGDFEYQRMRALRYRAVRLLVRRYFTVTGTRQAALAAHRLFGIPEADVLRTWNGIDVDLLVPRVARDDLRSHVGVGRNTVTIGTAANLRTLKRIDWLIEAADHLPPGDWQIVILGDGEDRARLEALAKASSARGRIRFVGMRQDIADWLNALDVFVLPSGPEESFGNAIVEAMACRLPVVVSADSPALAEHIEHGRTGFVIRDQSELARLLAELIVSPHVRKAVGTDAAAFAREKYSIDRVVERYDRLYEELVTQRRTTL